MSPLHVSWLKTCFCLIWYNKEVMSGVDITALGFQTALLREENFCFRNTADTLLLQEGI